MSTEGQDVLVKIDLDESRRYAKRYRTTRWARIRATGRGPFLWSYGVLGIGIPLLISKIFLDLYKNNRLPLMETFMSIVLLPLCGLLIGYLTWIASERRFREKMRG